MVRGDRWAVSAVQPMTKQETTQFMLEGISNSKLGTVRCDGRPRVTPVWFVLDGRVFDRPRRCQSKRWQPDAVSHSFRNCKQ